MGKLTGKNFGGVVVGILDLDSMEVKNTFQAKKKHGWVYKCGMVFFGGFPYDFLV